MKKYSFLGFVLILQFFFFALLNGFGILSADDIATVHTTSLEFSKVWNRALVFEQQAPLYFVLMNIWRSVSDSLFWAKLFNYVVFAFTTLFFYKAIKYYIPEKRSRYLFLIFFALHPFIFFISNDLRRYSLTLFFSIVTIYYTLKIYTTDAWSWRDYFLLMVFSVLGVLNDYFHAFLLAGLGASLLFLKNSKKWSFFAAMIPPIIVFFVLLEPLFYQLENSENWAIVFIENNILYFSIRHAIHLIEAQTYPLSFSGFGFASKLFFRVVFVLLIGFALIKELSKSKTNLKEKIIQKFKPRNLLILGPALIFITLYIFITIVLKSTNYLLPRYMGFSFPFFFIGFVLIIESFNNNNFFNFRNLTIMVLVILYFINYHNIYNYKHLHQTRFKLISERIAEELPQTHVFVLDPKNAEMINYYINDPSKKVIGIPNQFDFEFYNFSKRLIQSEEQIQYLFESYNLNKDYFFVVSTIRTYDLNGFNSNILKDHLNNNYELQAKEIDNGFYIMKYRKSLE